MDMNISKNNKRIGMKICFYLLLILMFLNIRSEAQGFGSLKPKITDSLDTTVLKNITSVLKSRISAKDFYKTTFLNIFETDFEQELNYNDAQKACTNLGENWRLPNLDELDMIFKASKEGDNFANTYYWTATEYNKFNAWALLLKNYGNFNKEFYGKSNKLNVRAVKTFTFDVLIENSGIRFDFRLGYNAINSIVLLLGDGWRLPSEYELKMLKKNSKTNLVGDYAYLNDLSSYRHNLILIREIK
jgi:hypothetical protein